MDEPKLSFGRSFRPVAESDPCWVEPKFDFNHFRDKDGAEVDIVLERGANEIAGIEIKASSTVTAKDFRGLKRLMDAAGDRFIGGAVHYDGEDVVPFGHKLYAVPVSAIWETR